MVNVGILGLQGAIEPHEQRLSELGIPHLRITKSSHLEQIDAIILPGGESTTMLKLLNTQQLFEPLKEFCLHHPVWGICAGAILLAKEVVNPAQQSLGILDIRAERNSYGSQLDSFSGTIDPVAPLEGAMPLEGAIEVDFIRAPRLFPMSGIDTKVHGVKPIYTYKGTPVGFVQGRCIVTAFHTELRRNYILYKHLLSL
jgi:5'-phosphate synthase pdxT subunit